MTHFLDEPSLAVAATIDALVRLSGGRLTRLDGYPDIKVVRRADLVEGEVAVLSGGGAGHEPAHAGFVGSGLLTVAVSGEIFASPSVEAVLAAALSADTGAGTLFVVKNYTGDRLNFGLAAERARAAGHRVEMVVVSDDVALKDSPQPRGIGGTLFVHKVAGATAQSGADLDEVSRVARAVATSVKTLGVSSSSVGVPGRGPARPFPEGRAELGLGIHGEPGVREIDVREVRDIVAEIASALDAELPATCPVALLINDLGGLSALELGVIAGDLLDTPLGSRAELVFGPSALMTSLDMKGFSVSALPLDDATVRAALTAPSDPAAAWPPAARPAQLRLTPLPDLGAATKPPASSDPVARAVLTAVGEALIAERGRLDALDAQVGDGDTGSTFALAAERVSSELDRLPLADRPALLRRLGELVSVSMGGSSGVLLSIMFTAAAGDSAQGSDLVTSLTRGVEAMQRHGGAQPGGRTMLDALLPGLDQLAAGAGARAAARAAAEGAAGTAHLDRATAGRSAYVPAEHLTGVEDPGAEAIAVAFAAAASALERTSTGGAVA
jgi:triose/dihydroxyacetone kinase / FAD-AMP lyase (cyclizing)